MPGHAEVSELTPAQDTCLLGGQAVDGIVGYVRHGRNGPPYPRGSADTVK
jgi:hypothetical protein